MGGDGLTRWGGTPRAYGMCGGWWSNGAGARCPGQAQLLLVGLLVSVGWFLCWRRGRRRRRHSLRLCLPRTRRRVAAESVGPAWRLYWQYDGIANQLLGGASAEPFSMSIDQALPKGLPYEKIPTGAQP